MLDKAKNKEYNLSVKFFSFTLLIFMKDLVKILKLLDTYGEMLTLNQKEMVEMYYSLNLTLGEIAEMKGVSRQCVFDTLNKAVKELELLESKIGFNAFKDKLKEITENYPESIKNEIVEFIDK